jgi:hypothetical protein
MDGCGELARAVDVLDAGRLGEARVVVGLAVGPADGGVLLRARDRAIPNLHALDLGLAPGPAARRAAAAAVFLAGAVRAAHNHVVASARVRARLRGPHPALALDEAPHRREDRDPGAALDPILNARFPGFC